MVWMGLLLKFLKWDQHLSEKALLKKSWSWMLLGSIELGIPPLMVTIREHATSESISAPKSVLWFSTSKARERGFLLVSESSSKETNHKGNKEQYRLHWRNTMQVMANNSSAHSEWNAVGTVLSPECLQPYRAANRGMLEAETQSPAILAKSEPGSVS